VAGGSGAVGRVSMLTAGWLDPVCRQLLGVAAVDTAVARAEFAYHQRQTFRARQVPQCARVSAGARQILHAVGRGHASLLPGRDAFVTRRFYEHTGAR
jgi:hypothetical protein